MKKNYKYIETKNLKLRLAPLNTTIPTYHMCVFVIVKNAVGIGNSSDKRRDALFYCDPIYERNTSVVWLWALWVQVNKNVECWAISLSFEGNSRVISKWWISREAQCAVQVFKIFSLSQTTTSFSKLIRTELIYMCK